MGLASAELCRGRGLYCGCEGDSYRLSYGGGTVAGVAVMNAAVGHGRAWKVSAKHPRPPPSRSTLPTPPSLLRTAASPLHVAIPPRPEREAFGAAPTPSCPCSRVRRVAVSRRRVSPLSHRSHGCLPQIPTADRAASTAHVRSRSTSGGLRLLPTEPPPAGRSQRMGNGGHQMLDVEKKVDTSGVPLKGPLN